MGVTEGSGQEIVGESRALRSALELARRAASTDMPVLIVGETGTGKELLAQMIHRESGKRGPLLPIDCGALPDELIESILFGHRRGSFTGAVEHVSGLIAEADGGTLFMDELSSLSLRGQAKLLRVLETGSVRRVGETRSRPVSFRVIATAQHSIGDQLRDGAFRYDLMQRVAGIVICLPALRERDDDVERLAHHFAGKQGLVLEQSAASILARRHWPGNVRELKWVLARCAFFAVDRLITRRSVRLALELGPGQLGGGACIPLEAESDARLRELCRLHLGDADEVARALGVARSTLYRRLRNAGLRLEAFRRATSA